MGWNLIHKAPKIGYAETSILMNEFKEAIQARKTFDNAKSEWEKNLAFAVSRNCWIEVAGQRFPIIQSQLENTWGIGRDTRFMVLFGNDARQAFLREKKFSLVFDDFIPGQVRTKFSWLFPLGRYDEIP